MRQILDNSRRAFIHDFDGVHYDYSAFPDIYEFLGEVKAEAVKSYFPDLSPEEAKRRGKESYKLYGDGLKVFVDMAEEAGWDPHAFRGDLHVLYHQICYRRTMAEYASLFDHCQETNQAFENLRGSVRHGVLTLSCVESWAKPLLKMQNRLQYFEQDALIGFADTGFSNKADSARPLEIALERLRARADEAVFIEDSLPNIAMAKKFDKRILTVYVTHGKEPSEIPECVDIQISKPVQFLKMAGETCAITNRPSTRVMEFHI